MSVQTTKINNRRYLGNKYRLLPFITKVVTEHCGDFNSFTDIFAGTGAVASAYIKKQLTTNDILFSNYISNTAWFSPENYDWDKLVGFISEYNDYNATEENYMTKNFSDTYFSHDICSKIGFIREDIEDKKNSKIINNREYAILLTSLLYAMDRIANTCGHYDAWRKNVDLSAQVLEMRMLVAEKNLNANNLCFNTDSNKLAANIKSDIVYLDPPYNSRQYCDAYHLVENVACWQKPEVFGVAKKMDRTSLKSKYCTQSAPKAFDDLISKLDTRYILVSYNNMENKGNVRSNARISDEEIITSLKKRGNVQIFSEDYKAFTTGKSDRTDNQERLFLCKCQ